LWLAVVDRAALSQADSSRTAGKKYAYFQKKALAADRRSGRAICALQDNRSDRVADPPLIL